MANLVSYSKSPIIKPQKSAIIKADKFLNTKSTKVNANSVKPKQSKNSSEDILLKIEKKVIKIDKLLKDSFALKKKQQKKVRIKGEQKEFEDREKELEKKKPKKEKGVNLPTPPKMGFLDWIKNFITQTVLGFIAVRLIDFLPQLLKILPIIIKVTDFITDIGGKLLDGLVTFIDWGYKAYDATRGFIKNIFGENGVKQFDQLSGVLNKFLNLAIIAGLVAAGSGAKPGSGGKPGSSVKPGSGAKPGAGAKPGQGGRPKVTTSGGGGSGRPNIRNPLRQRPGVTTSGGGTGGLDIRNPLRAKPKVTLGGGGNKALLSSVRPFLKRIPLPVVGALIDFGLSIALGENVGRAAFRAIGAGLLGAVGAAVGSVVPIAGNIIGGIIGGTAGDIAGGALYDMFFTGKKPNQKQGKTNKLAGGGSPIPSTRRGKSVSSAPTRTLKKKKKSTRSLSIIPSKIKPGKSTGGEDKVQSVFPNPKKQWWDPFGLFSGKPQQQQQQQKKPTEKVSNPQEFLLESNDVLGKSNFFGPFFTLALKSVLGDKPNKLDYLKVGQGLNSWMQGVFKTGPLGFAGGGEVDAKQFFGGEDYTQVIAKSVEDSVSKEIDTTIRNLKDELSLRKPVGKEEMIQENIRKSTEGGGGGVGGGGGGYDDSPHGTPGPAVQATSGFNPGKGDKTRKIFLHWSAGSHNQNFNNYHTTFLGNGKAVRNRGYGVDGTEHTAGANTNSVGLAIAAMKDGAENKFGSFPPTSAQVSAMALEAARLAVAWGWDESTIEKNVRTHGEWERYATKSGILPGRPQRWDLDKLRQSDPTNSGGDKLRKMIKSYFKKLKAGATVDSSGKVISKTTGSPLAQMSLETAMEMTEPGSGSGARISGGTKDFWALSAISALEGINAQGEADVAQSIYNRAAAGIFPGGKSIHSIITKDPKQYSPVGESDPALWAAIKDKESAIKAVASHKNGKTNASKKVESAAKNIKNPALQAEASKFVGGRTDFNALSVYGSDPPGAISVVKRHGHRFGFWVGGGSKNYGRSNPKAAGVPSLGATVSSTGGSATYESGTGGKGYGSAGGKLAGELGRYIKEKLRQGPDFSQVHRHPEHPPYSLTSGHSSGSLHYEGRAVDIGGFTREQGPILAAIAEFNKMKGIKPTQLLHGKNEPKDHWNHVHVAYAGGGETLNGPHQALIGEEGTEYVIDNKSFETTENFLPGLLDVLNYNVNDKASLIKYLPNIISSISQYTDDNIMKEYIFIQSPPEIRYVSTGSGGSPNIFIGGGVNNNIEQTLCQIG